MEDPDEDDSGDPSTSDESQSDPSSVDSLTCPKCKKTFTTKGRLETHTRKPPKCCIEAQVRLARQLGTQACPRLAALATQPLHIQLQEYRKSTFLPDHIPKAVRKEVTKKLMEVMRGVIDHNSDQAWKDLLTFAYRFLGQSKSSPVSRPSLPATIRDNLRGEVEPANAWASSAYEAKDKASPAAKDKALVKRVHRKLQEGDVSGAVRHLISEETILPPSPEVLKALQTKHPEELPGPPLAGEETPLPPALTGDEVYKAIRAFPKGSAAGPDGLKPQHLKEPLGSVSGVDHVRFLELLASLGNVMLKGAVPESARGTLYGANLHAFKKKDGGIRPIAVGVTFRRLVARVVSRRLDHLRDKFIPTQLGFSVKGGMEAAVHAVRCYVERHETHADVKAILKLDVKNAFNALDRGHLLQAVRTEIPEYYRLLHQSYGGTSFLLTGNGIILSRRGVQQGDPLGPLVFCLATHPLHKDLRAEVQVSYLDDDVLCGRPRDVIRDLVTLSERYDKAGLEFNIAKSEIFLLGGGESQRNLEKLFIRKDHPDFTWTAAQDLSYLGSPLTPSGTPSKIQELTSKARMFDKRLALLNSQTALYLLANSLGPVRTMHLLRTSRAYDHPELLKEYDRVIESSVVRLSKNEFTEDASLQASLPMAKGGNGIRRTEELALPAFLASAHFVQDLASRIVPFDSGAYARAALMQWSQLTGQPAVPAPKNTAQEAWDAPVVDTSVRQLHLLKADDPTFLPRIKAVSTPEASAWLRALPIASVGAALDDETVRIEMALRLGLKVCAQHTCRCGSIADRLGHHALSCGMSAGRFGRHARLNDAVSRALHSAGFPNELEPQGMSALDAKRPDGRTLIPFLGPKEATWDVTCVDTLAISNIADSTEKAGSAAAKAEANKKDKYQNLQQNYMFLPLGFETLGSFGPQTISFVEKVGSILKFKQKEPRATDFLRQRLSLEIQRGNAVSVLGTRPDGDDLNEMFLY